MKPATLPELKKELKQLSHEEILQLCLRLGRFKKDNKELLTYLVFESKDEQAYINSIKYEIDDLMEEINTSHLYYAKKGIQKINRNLTKYVRYSGNKQTEVEVFIYFLQSIKNSGIAIHRSNVLSNMYDRVLNKIRKSLAALHEDIQADYRNELESLQP